MGDETIKERLERYPLSTYLGAGAAVGLIVVALVIAIGRPDPAASAKTTDAKSRTAKAADDDLGYGGGAEGGAGGRGGAAEGAGGGAGGGGANEAEGDRAGGGGGDAYDEDVDDDEPDGKQGARDSEAEQGADDDDASPAADEPDDEADDAVDEDEDEAGAAEEQAEAGAAAEQAEAGDAAKSAEGGAAAEEDSDGDAVEIDDAGEDNPTPPLPTSDRSAEASMTADELYAAAKAEYEKGNYRDAFRLATRSYYKERRPESQFLRGKAACSLKDEKAAKEIVKSFKLSDPKRKQLRDHCKDKGLRVGL